MKSPSKVNENKEKKQNKTINIWSYGQNMSEWHGMSMLEHVRPQRAPCSSADEPTRRGGAAAEIWRRRLPRCPGRMAATCKTEG